MARQHKKPDLGYIRPPPPGETAPSARPPAERRNGILTERVEIGITVAADAALVAFSILVRHYLLALVHWADPAGEYQFIVRATEILADYALVGTMLFLTVFDLLKRARHAVRELFRE